MSPKTTLLAAISIISVSILALVLWNSASHKISPAPQTAGIEASQLAFLKKKLAKKSNHPERYDKPEEAWEFYAQQRAPLGTDVIPVEKYVPAHEQMHRMPRYSAHTQTTLPSLEQIGDAAQESEAAFQGWESLGPGNVGGRTRAMLIDPKNPSVMYAAGVAGGIWKTNNGGSSWIPLDDMMANLAITTLAMEPKRNTVIYAGTGEGFYNIDNVRGNGIFRTTNAGKTWKQLPATANNSDFHYVNKLVVSPKTPARLYAATRTGFWRSDDFGKSWKQVYKATETAGCLDIAVRSDLPKDHVLVSCGSFSQASIYRSTDNGKTLKSVLTEPNMGRTSLAVSPSNPSVMYALSSSVDRSSDYVDGLHAVFRSNNGGATWQATVRNTSPTHLNTLLLSNTVFGSFADCGFGSQNYYFNQGWYDNVIAVDPKDPNIVWVGGIDLFRSDDGGKNWGVASYWWSSPNVAAYAHADQHGLIFHPDYDGNTNKTLYVTNDGGIFRTTNARARTATGPQAACDDSFSSLTWNNLNNGYAVTQFYHGLPYPDGTAYLGGAQDNGTNRGNDIDGPNQWVEITGGDGGYVAVYPRNTNVLFTETTNLSIQKSTDGGKTFKDAIKGISESPGNFLFINPFTMDFAHPFVMWTGGSSLWRTKNLAGSWVRASISNMAIDGSFSAVGTAPASSNFVVAGTSTGRLFASRKALNANGGTHWQRSRPAKGYISSVTYHPSKSNIIYATYSTFGVDHIWKSTNAGKSWKAIDQRGKSNGIPDIPVHTLAIDPDNPERLFAGTDLGIFVSTDDGKNWMVENTGFTNTVVENLSINTVNGENTLFAFTHGRGAWKTILSP